MDYGLMAFDGNHCGHVAAWVDHNWRTYRNREALAVLRRRGVGR